MTVRKFSNVSKKTSKQKFKKTQVRYLEYYSDPLKLNVGVFL